MKLKTICGILFFICSTALVSAAQTAGRQPIAPIRPFVVKTAQSIAGLEKSLRSENKTEDLTGGEGTQLRVAVQHDEKRDAAEAESHDDSDDVYYVLEGRARLTLGGKLENPREVSPGEWRSERIIEGKTFEIKKGDLIIVPRGTPHHRINAPENEFSLILIKVFAKPLPPAEKK